MDAVLLIKGPRLENHTGAPYKVLESIQRHLRDDHMDSYPITLEEVRSGHSGDYMEIHLECLGSADTWTTQSYLNAMHEEIFGSGPGAVILIEEPGMAHHPDITVSESSKPDEVKAAYLKWRSGLINRLDGSIELAFPSISVDKVT